MSPRIDVGVFRRGALPLVVLVGAARLRLKRHTPAQILAGTLVGAIVPVVVVLLLAAYIY